MNFQKDASQNKVAMKTSSSFRSNSSFQIVILGTSTVNCYFKVLKLPGSLQIFRWPQTRLKDNISLQSSFFKFHFRLCSLCVVSIFQCLISLLFFSVGASSNILSLFNISFDSNLSWSKDFSFKFVILCKTFSLP